MQKTARLESNTESGIVNTMSQNQLKSLQNTFRRILPKKPNMEYTKSQIHAHRVFRSAVITLILTMRITYTEQT